MPPLHFSILKEFTKITVLLQKEAFREARNRSQNSRAAELAAERDLSRVQLF